MFIFAILFLSPLMMLLMFFFEMYAQKTHTLDSAAQNFYLCYLQTAIFMDMKQIPSAFFKDSYLG